MFNAIFIITGINSVLTTTINPVIFILVTVATTTLELLTTPMSRVGKFARTRPCPSLLQASSAGGLLSAWHGYALPLSCSGLAVVRAHQFQRAPRRFSGAVSIVISVCASISCSAADGTGCVSPRYG